MGSNYNKGNNTNGRGGGGGGGGGGGRSYGMLLVVAFGAALVGFLILHKLRERRIYNLILQQKDQHLFSLQLLFQKEKGYGEEVKRKNEEMKGKIYDLRNQKAELDGRLLEMQSTVDSLKDELKTMEVALKENQIEIETLRAERDRTSRKRENVALIKSLKQKEAEIEELKQKVWLVKKDDTSRPRNVTAGTAVNVNVEQGQSVDDNSGANSTEADHVKSKGDAGADGQLEKHKNLRNTKGETRLEIQDDGENGVRFIAAARGRHGFVGNSRVKRWRSIAKNRRLERKGKTNEGLSGKSTRSRGVEI